MRPDLEGYPDPGCSRGGTGRASDFQEKERSNSIKHILKKETAGDWKSGGLFCYTEKHDSHNKTVTAAE